MNLLMDVYTCTDGSNYFWLQGGVESKRQVDKVIDKCSAMQVLAWFAMELVLNLLYLPS
jgi:hypothetical protein